MDLMRLASTARSMADQHGVAPWEKLSLKVNPSGQLPLTRIIRTRNFHSGVRRQRLQPWLRIVALK